MGKCTIDHSYSDVLTKLKGQADYMPDSLVQGINRFLEKTLSQEALNELFHLLKKYDLASQEEREKRNEEIDELIQV
ncbi:hypothetical protein ABFG93_04925 [Pseudalkalibacillus hwajinpoensis]|uniref:hypothetical protein n=1 Tax=Guptibacillus hwajinpoensis TaxID=208199 RepID=UPI00325A961C